MLLPHMAHLVPCSRCARSMVCQCAKRAALGTRPTPGQWCAEWIQLSALFQPRVGQTNTWEQNSEEELHNEGLAHFEGEPICCNPILEMQPDTPRIYLPMMQANCGLHNSLTHINNETWLQDALKRSNRAGNVLPDLSNRPLPSWPVSQLGLWSAFQGIQDFQQDMATAKCLLPSFPHLRQSLVGICNSLEDDIITTCALVKRIGGFDAEKEITMVLTNNCGLVPTKPGLLVVENNYRL